MEQNPENEDRDLISGHLDELRQIELEGYQLGVKRARNALFWVAGLIFAGEMIMSLIGGGGFDWFVFGFALVIAGIFVGLGFLTRVKPFTALITGLIAYIAYILLVVVVNGMMEGSGGYLKGLFSGIIVKIVIIVIMVRAIPDARKLQEAMKEK